MCEQFDCDDESKQCYCLSDSCDHICRSTECNDYSFQCEESLISTCSVICLGRNSCQNLQFYTMSDYSILQCIGKQSCQTV